MQCMKSAGMKLAPALVTACSPVCLLLQLLIMCAGPAAGGLPACQPDQLQPQLSALALSFAAVRHGKATSLRYQDLDPHLCQLLGDVWLQAHNCQLSSQLT